MVTESLHDDDDEFDYAYAESALGYGGVIVGRDGIGRSMPEPEALARAIPLWVEVPEHLEDAVDLCLQALERPEAVVRGAAAAFFRDVAASYRRMPRVDTVRAALIRATFDDERDIGRVASEALRAIEPLA